MSQTVELPRTGLPGGGLGGQWRVVVLNDEFNTFDHVAETLARVVPGVSLAEGYRIADRIHKHGLAIVWSGPR
ncbi:MAG TPA: ATP-dependent Clp protease adaptor ClpS, partial [Solirubrobacteraceae bacterium]|nr:ATP-dependent Clp protease adaptor ClpS [Solirubrobacteraceae bacterium]